jgi:hypothetical protein
MKIFNDIPPNNGAQSIQKAFAALANQVGQVVNGRAEWSIGELSIDHDDLCWLQAWAKNLRAEDTRFWLQTDDPVGRNEAQLKYAAVCGSLFLANAHEICFRGGRTADLVFGR